MPSTKEVRTMVEVSFPVKTLDETAINMAREGQILAVKIAPGRNNRVMIRIPYNQDLINKVKFIPKKKSNPEGKYGKVPYKVRHICVRTVQAIFKQACRKAGIKKALSIHSLRHIFITHLLGNGIYLKYMQGIPGNKSSKTTVIYTPVSKKNFPSIKSPLDSLLRRSGK